MASLAKADPPTTTFVEARKAEVVGKGRSFEFRWIWMPLARISPHLRRAVIVAEDATFYRHEGFDWEGMMEAVKRNWEKGKLQRGGSTITQQLAKNLYLSADKSLFRKVHEALITWKLERSLTKKRILELYLNVAEWGRGIYGAEAAARHYFHKAAEDLSPDEAALLAAMLPAPRQYDPLQITPYLARRQQEILKKMKKGG